MAIPGMETATADLRDQVKSFADHVPEKEAERKSPEMDTSTADLLDQFKRIADHVPKDEAERKQLFELSRNLTFALESPADTIQRICYLVSQSIPSAVWKVITWWCQCSPCS